MDYDHNKDSLDDEYATDFESDDEDYFAIVGFDEEEARNKLFSLKDSTQIVLNIDEQREMGLEVGPSVSAEKPWKMIRKEILEEFLPETSPELIDLKTKIKEMEDNQLILFGFASHLSEENDVFVIYETEKAAKEASEIIRKFEILDRLKARNLVIKQPRPWTSKGSEVEVDLMTPERREGGAYVEIQSTYPIRQKAKNFSMRMVEDAQDGYVELVPGRKKIEIVYKRTNDMAIQCGSVPNHKEQQTDPTFPTNAWSQYLYEIAEEKAVSKSSDTASSIPATSKSQSKATTPAPELNLSASEKVQNLIETLQFNKIDMYRDDYNLIAKHDYPRFQTPKLEESFCFAEISKTKDRFVSSVSWHPQLSGIMAASYTFETFSTFFPIAHETNIVQRTIIEKNPVLIWSFDDTLKPKLELFAPREVCVISFCPYDPNLLIGGMTSGDIIIWDLKGCIERVELEEVLTPEQARNRRMTQEFLNWMDTTDTDRIIQPAAVSCIEDSHLEAVSDIKWMPQNFYCTLGGQIKEGPDKTRRHFVTSSIDGSICFWDLDFKPSDEDLKKRKFDIKHRVPVELEEEESPYHKLDLVFRPTYRLLVEKPLSSILIDEGRYIAEPVSPQKTDITSRIAYKIIPHYNEHFEMVMVVGTISGEVCSGVWEGFDVSQGATVNQEKLQADYFPAVHDDPVIGLDRNPFIPDIFVSIGGTIFTLWKKDFKAAPIFWRRRPNRITTAKWSLDRAAVLFLTLEDGTFEAWDFLTRTNEPSLIETLGGNILTALSQHKLPLHRSVLAIGDYNSCLCIFLIPLCFTRPVKHEVENMIVLVKRIEKIKTEQEAWKKLWAEQNRDIIEARNVANEQMRSELGKMLEVREKEDKPRESTTSANRPKKDAKKLTYSEMMEKKWNEMNYERLLTTLMERRRLNPEILDNLTQPEKERRRYQAEKKEAIKASFGRIKEELADLRSRLIPKAVIDDSREKLVSAVAGQAMQHMKDYNYTKLEALGTIAKNAETVHIFSNTEILERARQRREIIDRALGGNPEMMAKYLSEKKKRQEDRLMHLSADIVSLQQSAMDTMSRVSDIKTDGNETSMSIR